MHESKSRPGLWHDRAFYGVIATQFLGAFNDNLFKMLLMLICADYVVALGSTAKANTYFDPYQTIASLLFACAFIVFCGTAGHLGDRYRKRSIIVVSKFAEIVVMTCGLVVVMLGSAGSQSLILLLFVVLFLMGTQSAFFGPAKYGIFPELFHESDLPVTNGVAQAATFLAVIFGAALAGPLKHWLQPDLWKISAVCIGIAVAGTASSLMIRSTPAAQPDLRLNPSGLFLEGSVWRSIVGDRPLLYSLLLYTMFWFIGGVVFLVVTLMGKVQMDLGDMRTSILNAMMGLGIGLGCVVAAVLSKHKMRTSLIHIGSWGLAASLTAASFIAVMPSGIGLQFWLLGAALLAGGFFGGWIAVPLQVFIQVRPKAEQKGRVIAAMNLITWCGILSASIYYFLSLAFTGFSMPPSYILASLGLLMIISHSIMYPKFIRHLQDENSTGLETAPLQAIGGLTK